MLSLVISIKVKSFRIDSYQNEYTIFGMIRNLDPAIKKNIFDKYGINIRFEGCIIPPPPRYKILKDINKNLDSQMTEKFGKNVIEYELNEYYKRK